jgi:hypothetical protein
MKHTSSKQEVIVSKTRLNNTTALTVLQEISAVRS